MISTGCCYARAAPRCSSGHEFAIKRIGRIATGAVVAGWAASQLALPWDLARIAVLAFAVFGVVCFHVRGPLACVSYFPLVFVLGVQDPLGSPRWAQVLAPMTGPLFLLIALAGFTRLGVRRYQSTGS